MGQLPSGQYQLFIGLHLIHEVTSPQAFAMIREQGLSVPFRAYICHSHFIIPTTGSGRRQPLQDPLAEEMLQHISKTPPITVSTFLAGKGEQGVVHLVGPERPRSRNDDCLRRFAHLHARGVWHAGLRHRHESSCRRAATQTLAMAKLGSPHQFLRQSQARRVPKDVALHTFITLA